MMAKYIEVLMPLETFNELKDTFYDETTWLVEGIFDKEKKDQIKDLYNQIRIIKNSNKNEDEKDQ